MNCTPDDYCPMRRVPSKIFSPHDIFPGFANEDLCPTQIFVINRLRILKILLGILTPSGGKIKISIVRVLSDFRKNLTINAI